ncbi:hypothetical protein IP90_01393 [Luteimonas cucumeris]|uniref:Uncharacterized protein n=1 Tax=Luteimonas cucumeris TaxID=985012 RepID=A0A562L7F8_9GAMM|nr:hypothetical protein IP90_01393 [Luteimonas cucumeris]
MLVPVNAGILLSCFCCKVQSFRLAAGHFLCWPKESNQRKGLKPEWHSLRTTIRALVAFVATIAPVPASTLKCDRCRQSIRDEISWRCWAMAELRLSNRYERILVETLSGTPLSLLWLLRRERDDTNRLLALSLVTFFGPAKKVTRRSRKLWAFLSSTVPYSCTVIYADHYLLIMARRAAEPKKAVVIASRAPAEDRYAHRTSSSPSADAAPSRARWHPRRQSPRLARPGRRPSRRSATNAGNCC